MSNLGFQAKYDINTTHDPNLNIVGLENEAHGY